MTSSPQLTWRRLLGAVGFGSVALFLAALLGLGWGSSALSGGEVALGLLTGSLDDVERAIVFDARLPRVVFGALVGAALSCSGAIFQALLRNPLADPYILGVSGGAALGATIAFVAGPAVGGALALGTSVAMPVAAFVGALLSVGLILLVGRWTPGGRAGTYVLLLTGVVFNAFASAIITFIRTILSPQKAHELLFYLVGTLDVEGTSVAQTVFVAVCALVAVAISLVYARDLNVLTLGDEEAVTLGVDVPRVRVVLVLAASLGVAVCVAYTGLIGFVGLVVPHGVRLLLGPDHRVLLPASALFGAAFLVLADLGARAAFGVFSTALPVGVVTAFVGAPVFLLFLRTSLTRG